MSSTRRLEEYGNGCVSHIVSRRTVGLMRTLLRFLQAALQALDHLLSAVVLCVEVLNGAQEILRELKQGHAPWRR